MYTLPLPLCKKHRIQLTTKETSHRMKLFFTDFSRRFSLHYLNRFTPFCLRHTGEVYTFSYSLLLGFKQYLLFLYEFTHCIYNPQRFTFQSKSQNDRYENVSWVAYLITFLYQTHVFSISQLALSKSAY